MAFSNEVDGNRKADALISAAAAGNRRVQADHFSTQIDQRPTTITWIDGRIGLEEIL